MRDSLPKESTSKLKTKGTGFTRGSIKDSVSFTKGQRKTGNVSGIGMSANTVGKDSKMMKGL